MSNQCFLLVFAIGQVLAEISTSFNINYILAHRCANACLLQITTKTELLQQSVKRHLKQATRTKKLHTLSYLHEVLFIFNGKQNYKF